MFWMSVICIFKFMLSSNLRLVGFSPEMYSEDCAFFARWLKSYLATYDRITIEIITLSLCILLVLIQLQTNHSVIALEK